MPKSEHIKYSNEQIRQVNLAYFHKHKIPLGDEQFATFKADEIEAFIRRGKEIEHS